MQKIAKFEKVSKKRYNEDIGNAIPVWSSQVEYEDLRMPRRATKGSAGYGFFAPFNISLEPGESIVVPTGMRCKIKEGWVLMLYPRSGFGFKYRIQLDNTVGIIDSDYYNADNEGHIMVKITNDSKSDKIFSCEKGVEFCQGVFHEYGITEDDDVKDKRVGGFGSTGV